MGEKEIKQALGVLNQALNVAVGNGVFKNPEDVTLIYNSLTVVGKALSESYDKDVEKETQEVKPKKLQKTK